LKTIRRRRRKKEEDRKVLLKLLLTRAKKVGLKVIPSPNSASTENKSKLPF
jgi:hypothetical protein